MDSVDKSYVNEIKAVLVSVQTRLDALENNFSEIEDSSREVYKKFSKLQTLVEEQNNIDNAASSGNKNVSIDDEKLEIMIKKILLEDKELNYTFAKIIENVWDFKEQKAKIDDMVEKSVKSKKTDKRLIIFSIFTVLLLAFGGYFSFKYNTTPKEFIIPANSYIYNAKGERLELSSQYKIFPTSVKNGKIYFMVNGEKYYYKKPWSK